MSMHWSLGVRGHWCGLVQFARRRRSWSGSWGSMILKALDAVFHQFQLHLQSVDFVSLVRHRRHLRCQDVDVARVVACLLRLGCPRMPFRSHLMNDSDDMPELLLQPAHGLFDLTDLAAVRLEHAGVERDLRLQARESSRPHIAGRRPLLGGGDMTGSWGCAFHSTVRRWWRACVPHYGFVRLRRRPALSVRLSPVHVHEVIKLVLRASLLGGMIDRAMMSITLDGWSALSVKVVGKRKRAKRRVMYESSRLTPGMIIP